MSAAWQAKRTKIAGMDGEIVAIASAGHALTVAEAIALWLDDAPFRAFFIAGLAASEYRAFFWEMPPVEQGALSHPFECAVIRADALARLRADDTDFARQLNAGTEPVTAFPNLGGDALLIAPRRMSDADCYGHIAAFLRAAPEAQRHALFELLARKIEERIAETSERFWVSTSGLGVPWVHVRLDSWPKYYQYRRYAMTS